MDYVLDIAVCVVLLEVSRIAGVLTNYNGKLQILFPLYTTLIPFALLCFLSREARIHMSFNFIIFLSFTSFKILLSLCYSSVLH